MQISSDSRVAGPGQISVALLSFWQSGTEIELIFLPQKEDGLSLISFENKTAACSSVVLACAGITALAHQLFLHAQELPRGYGNIAAS